MINLSLDFRVGLAAATFVVSGIMAVLMFCLSLSMNLWGWMSKLAMAYIEGGYTDQNLVGLMLIVSMFLLAGAYFQRMAYGAARFVLNPK